LSSKLKKFLIFRAFCPENVYGGITSPEYPFWLMGCCEEIGWWKNEQKNAGSQKTGVI